jgi:PIN domain nuclease of toxin-antitoxin system
VRVLADTHAVLWWRGEPGRLSPAARRELERADPVLLSAISIWEIATLVRLNRIRLDRDLSDWVTDLLAEGIAVADLKQRAALDAGSWSPDEFPGDPADRLIYATARDLRVPLVSKDERMHDVAGRRGDVKVIW